MVLTCKQCRLVEFKTVSQIPLYKLLTYKADPFSFFLQSKTTAMFQSNSICRKHPIPKQCYTAKVMLTMKLFVWYWKTSGIAKFQYGYNYHGLNFCELTHIHAN